MFDTVWILFEFILDTLGHLYDVVIFSVCVCLLWLFMIRELCVDQLEHSSDLLGHVGISLGCIYTYIYILLL